jgi:hypothetical protein
LTRNPAKKDHWLKKQMQGKQLCEKGGSFFYSKKNEPLHKAR